MASHVETTLLCLPMLVPFYFAIGLGCGFASLARSTQSGALTLAYWSVAVALVGTALTAHGLVSYALLTTGHFPRIWNGSIKFPTPF